MKALGVIFIICLIAIPALAGDRLIEIQSRLTSALSGILPKTDYLVIVNQIDALENSGSSNVSGVVRNLPGLRVGVDEEGQVVVKDQTDTAYSGSVSVTVVIDSQVKTETFRAIEALMPEIMGGSRGGDEVKLKRAVLRQPEEKDQPQVVVNNTMPAPVDTSQAHNSDFMKFGVLFFIGLGAILWFISRQQPAEREDSRPRRQQPEPSYDRGGRDNSSSNELRSQRWDPAAFESFDPEVLGLFLMKSVFETDLGRARSFFKESTPTAQKNALSSLPSWLASYCLEQIEPKEGQTEVKNVNPELIMREVTVLEKGLKDDPSGKASAFIQWIPLDAMSKVHPESLAAPSDEARYAIISLRPDLARAFKYDENDALLSGMIFNAKAIVTAKNEMGTWKTRMGVSRSGKLTVVEAMAGIVNRAETFEEVDLKLKGIQKKMSKLDWVVLLKRVVSKETFEKLTEAQRKDFLRQCEAADYFFIASTYNVAFDWELEKLLRPKRLSAYRAAERMNIHQDWSEDGKREANVRVLAQLRAVYLGDPSASSTQAAA